MPATTKDGQPAGPRGGGWRRFRAWPRLARVATYAGAALVLVLLAALLSVVQLVRTPFSQTTGSVDLPGLEGSVEVLRDDHGIPQLYGDSLEDLMRAQGYVHAQERFFEMDVRRHASAGRLAEMFGAPVLASDEYVRTLGWRRVAEQELALVRPETRAALGAYADGVNTYLDTHAPREIAVEYTVLNAHGLDYRPEEWTPVDSLAWLKAMAWDLRGNMTDEIDRVLALAGHTADEVAGLYPPYPGDVHAPIVGQGAVVDGDFEQDATMPGTRNPRRPAYLARTGRDARAALTRLRAGLGRMPALLGRGDGLGSNGWVVSGDHTTTGGPLLADDPHLGVSVPGPWMQMGLHCRTVTADCPLDVAGFTFSGVPGVIVGHNADIAWGFTNLGADVSDLYLERVEGDRWRYDGQWRPLRTRTETIRVQGADDVRITVRSTAHGPLLSDVDGTVAAAGQDPPGVGGGPRGHPARGRGRAPPTPPPRCGGPRCTRPRPPTRSSSSTRRPTGTPSVRRRRPSRRRRRACCTPTGPATSATRPPGASRSAGPATTECSPAPAGSRRTTGPASTSRSTGCPGCSTPRKASSWPPTRRSSPATTPTASVPTGTWATARSGSGSCCSSSSTRAVSPWRAPPGSSSTT